MKIEERATRKEREMEDETANENEKNMHTVDTQGGAI